MEAWAGEGLEMVLLRLVPMAFLARLALGLSLSNILLSQNADASPAWLLEDYDVSKALSNAEHNGLGAVASENAVCSSIGIDILKIGGNAADALVATVLCVGVIAMYHRYVVDSLVLY